MVEIVFRCNFSVMFEDLTLCMLNIFLMFLLLSAFFIFKINLFIKFFNEHYQSVKILDSYQRVWIGYND